MLNIMPDWENEVEIEITGDEDSHKPDPYDDVYRNIPKKHICSRLKKIAGYAVRKSFSTKLWGCAARKGR